MARQTWAQAGVKSAVIDTPESYTGAAYIFVEETTGNNAIIVSPGAAMLISPADIEANAGLIGSAGVFVTQLEQPIDAALRALEIARGAGVTHDPQSGAGGNASRSHLHALRLCHAQRDRGRGTDRHQGFLHRRRPPRRRQPARKGRRRGHRHARRKGRAAAHGRSFRPCRRGQCRPGGRDDRRGRRLQWRPGRSAFARAWSRCRRCASPAPSPAFR